MLGERGATWRDGTDESIRGEAADVLSSWSLTVAIPVLVGAALVTTVAGAKLSELGDVLLDRLPLGEALFGAVFFGGIISLSGIVMTDTAGASGYPQLAFSNAVGGVAAQTMAIGVADAFYRPANEEHAAGSAPNMMSGAVVAGMLTIVLLARHASRCSACTRRRSSCSSCTCSVCD